MNSSKLEFIQAIGIEFEAKIMVDDGRKCLQLLGFRYSFGKAHKGGHAEFKKAISLIKQNQSRLSCFMLDTMHI